MYANETLRDAWAVNDAAEGHAIDCDLDEDCACAAYAATRTVAYAYADGWNDGRSHNCTDDGPRDAATELRRDARTAITREGRAYALGYLRGYRGSER